MRIEADVPRSRPVGMSDRLGTAHDLANSAMRALCRLIPWDAYSLSAWDVGSGTRKHLTLAGEGYPPGVQVYMNDTFVQSDPTFALLHARTPGAMRWKDLQRDWSIAFARTAAAEEFLIPAGFREGTTMCLRLPNGRYTGALHVSWASADRPGGSVRETIESFSALLANVCDLLRFDEHPLDGLGSATHVVVIAQNGTVTRLAGRDPGPWLTAGSALPTLIAVQGRWLDRCRYLWIDDDGDCHRVQFERRGGSLLLSERTIPWPFGLSAREAEIVHLVAEGLSNPEIASHLCISPRTVSTHVEHILRKLDCSSRARLAALAIQADLLVLNRVITRH